MQDPNLHPWGAQDRFQAHFIVRKTGNLMDFTARTVLSTKGHFRFKKVSSVKWNGLLVLLPFSISLLKAPLTKLLGEIVPWYVTPPLVQLVFVLVLYSLQIFAA